MHRRRWCRALREPLPDVRELLPDLTLLHTDQLRNDLPASVVGDTDFAGECEGVRRPRPRVFAARAGLMKGFETFYFKCLLLFGALWCTLVRSSHWWLGSWMSPLESQ